MDTNDLKLLVERYWEGKTSLQEEEQLKDWFRHHDAPEGMEREAMLFGYYQEQEGAQLSPAFEERLMTSIHQGGQSRSEARVVSLWPKLVNWRAAAVISGIIVASVVLKNPFVSSPHTTDTYDNPQDAYEATKAILMTISTSMNKGKKYTEPLSKFSETQDKVASLGSQATDGGS